MIGCFMLHVVVVVVVAVVAPAYQVVHVEVTIKVAAILSTAAAHQLW